MQEVIKDCTFVLFSDGALTVKDKDNRIMVKLDCEFGYVYPYCFAYRLLEDICEKGWKRPKYLECPLSYEGMMFADIIMDGLPVKHGKVLRFVF